MIIVTGDCITQTGQKRDDYEGLGSGIFDEISYATTVWPICGIYAAITQMLECFCIFSDCVSATHLWHTDKLIHALLFCRLYEDIHVISLCKTEAKI